MKKPLKIAASPLTGAIYAGTLIKNDTMWGANKQDVTMDCLIATIEHCLKLGKTVEIINSNGNVDFEIEVKDLRLIKRTTKA
ncbi:hypothetical protein A6E13_15825 [Aliivibrio fischeri]|uniref:DUF7446 family protein n=1 Tax=Aliivibrio fischeri TaxID=668 RepID=UPI00080E9CB0|nr:hypothetical protein [Aliivibrio fischeri]OCH31986.1 hypothetical protein A6E13_15825 [Aliivibrio fischeri]